MVPSAMSRTGSPLRKGPAHPLIDKHSTGFCRIATADFRFFFGAATVRRIRATEVDAVRDMVRIYLAPRNDRLVGSRAAR